MAGLFRYTIPMHAKCLEASLKEPVQRGLRALSIIFVKSIYDEHYNQLLPGEDKSIAENV